MPHFSYLNFVEDRTSKVFETLDSPLQHTTRSLQKASLLYSSLFLCLILTKHHALQIVKSAPFYWYKLLLIAHVYCLLSWFTSVSYWSQRSNAGKLPLTKTKKENVPTITKIYFLIYFVNYIVDIFLKKLITYEYQVQSVCI